MGPEVGKSGEASAFSGLDNLEAASGYHDCQIACILRDGAQGKTCPSGNS